MSRIGDSGDVWLYFDASLLVEIKPNVARTLVVDLADQLGMFVGVPAPEEVSK